MHFDGGAISAGRNPPCLLCERSASFYVCVLNALPPYEQVMLTKVPEGCEPLTVFNVGDFAMVQWAKDTNSHKGF